MVTFSRVPSAAAASDPEVTKTPAKALVAMTRPVTSTWASKFLPLGDEVFALLRPQLDLFTLGLAFVREFRDRLIAFAQHLTGHRED